MLTVKIKYAWVPSCPGTESDEVCTDRIDLVIAIDASGLITEKGFDLMKEFAKKLLKRMVAEYLFLSVKEMF